MDKIGDVVRCTNCHHSPLVDALSQTAVLRATDAEKMASAYIQLLNLPTSPRKLVYQSQLFFVLDQHPSPFPDFIYRLCYCVFSELLWQRSQWRFWQADLPFAR
jgi:hypothetical protein